MKKQHRSTPKTSIRVGKFAIIGIILAAFNFLIYTFLARVIMNTNELLWLDSIISYALATILAYILHSKITWRERNITRRGIFMFFLWNGITAIIISPFFTWLFGLITPVYEFAFNISSTLHLPFDYAFIESTGIFGLTTAVTMILNYLFYDRLVFGVTPVTYPALVSTPGTVSIIIPIYNTAKYLKKCLTSIANQDYTKLEIIMVDDGSTDTSAIIAKSFAASDPRFHYYYQKNQGQSSARNLGLSKATGDFISFVDADDYLDKTFISRLLAPYASTPATGLSVCGIRYNRLRTHTTEDVYLKPLRTRHPHESIKAYALYLLAIDGRLYSSVNKLYLAKYAKRCHFNTSINFAEDTDFVLHYLTTTPTSHQGIAFILSPLYIYNSGTDTSTMRSVATKWDNWRSAFARLKTWLGTHPSLRERFWLRLVHLRWFLSHKKQLHRAKSA